MSESQSKNFAFLQFLAADMSKGEISFPTFADATLRVRAALNDPEVSVERLAKVVGAEPLLSARVIKVANSVAFNPSGKPAGDIKTAIMRIGFAALRSVGMAVGMEQAMAVHELAKFRPKTEMIWRESVEVAAHSYVLARRLTKINPDEALLTGLLLDIGKFYLLARASHFPELADDTAELDRMLDEWHPSIGSAILGSLDLPETTLFAVAEHHGDAVSHPLRKLVDVIVVASRIVARNSASGGSSDGGKADAVDADSLRAVEEGKDELRSIVSGLSRS